MKKILSIMMLCLCCMAFVSCESTEEEYTGNKFKACAFVAMPTYSEDLRNLLDITVTYTAMDGTVKELKADKDGSFVAEDASYTLPATVKFVVKSKKSANYEAYKASKSTFDLLFLTPGYVAAWINQDGKETIAGQNTSTGGLSGLLAEKVDDFIKDYDKHLNFTFEGTYVKTDKGGCAFEVKK